MNQIMSKLINKKLILASLLTVSMFCISLNAYTSEEEPAAAAEPQKSGKELSQQCVACHGEDGNSPTSAFPRIAGQHEDYLLHSLRSYKNGERKNAIMAGIVAALSDGDMENLAEFFAKQKGLATVNPATKSN